MTQIVASHRRHPKGLWIDWQHRCFAALVSNANQPALR
jgi:hypothetical protein